MARALFFGLPLHGHTNPSLPLVAELVARGEEVTYYSSPAFAAQIERTGARFRPYRQAFLGEMAHLPERLEQLSWLLMQATSDILASELDVLRADRADYVITDSVAPWGQWIGEALGVPTVTSTSTFAINRHMFAYAAAHGVRPKSGARFFSKMRHVTKALLLRRRLQKHYRLRGPGVLASMFGESALNVVYTSRYFQPRAETFDDRFHFVGPSMGRRTDTPEFPWDEVRRPVLVYVSMGTLFNADPAFYRHCFEAFRAEDVHVVMAIGSQTSSSALGDAPSNFTVRGYVPQLDVLQRASVFVTHGGMNSVSESLYFGVPLVVVPQMGEQEIVGRRAEELGAGCLLAKETVTAETLRDSVRRVLGDGRFRSQAKVVGDSFREAGGVARAADAILAFTRRGKAGRSPAS